MIAHITHPTEDGLTRRIALQLINQHNASALGRHNVDHQRTKWEEVKVETLVHDLHHCQQNEPAFVAHGSVLPLELLIDYQRLPRPLTHLVHCRVLNRIQINVVNCRDNFQGHI